jgi:hypothetical protein
LPCRSSSLFEGVRAGFEAFGKPLRELLVHHGSDPPLPDLFWLTATTMRGELTP